LKDGNITYKLEGDQLVIGGTLTLATIRELLDYFDGALNTYSGKILTIRLDTLEDADSAGITTIHYLREKLKDRDTEVHIEGGSQSIRQK